MPAATRATTDGADHMEDAHAYDPEMGKRKRTPNRLILCFDGTGNKFLGNTSDTNIVKLYDKFDRSAPHQMHYYQPGIGTYSGDGSSVNTSWLGTIQKWISQQIDSGFGTTFDSHVIAGYRFLMRYYDKGDRIYIFGFSRGAFTARFLARMISQVGLLSKGNEEMVPFAYKTYQDYELGAYQDSILPEEEVQKSGEEEVQRSGEEEVQSSGEEEVQSSGEEEVQSSGEEEDPEAHKPSPKSVFIQNFKTTFCRHDAHPKGEVHSDLESGIKVHFLGLFDTVNSVGTFDVPFTKQVILPMVGGTAEHVRHAVAIDERRVKFKAALLAQDQRKMPHDEDIKEVWFPGNHGDVGGGWPARNPKGEHVLTLKQKIERFFTKEKDTEPSRDVTKDWFQQSDIALKWMIDELDGIEGDQIDWDPDRKKGFMKYYAKRRDAAVKSKLHDTMRYGGGSSLGKTSFWNFMEFFPFIKRWEYMHGFWQYVTLPLNKGQTRDIPPGAHFHHSLLERMKNPNYRPMNEVWFYPYNKDDPDNDKKYKLSKRLHEVDTAQVTPAQESTPLVKKKPATEFVALPRKAAAKDKAGVDDKLDAKAKAAAMKKDNVYRIHIADGWWSKSI